MAVAVSPDTPVMAQWRTLKAKSPGAILWFRLGDFYEMFYEDAELASRVLGLTLTSRNNGGAAEVPLAGIPVKACAEYLRRLVSRGYRVAICEQVEDPKLAKGIVRREVIETITPGAAFADDLLDGTRHNFLCALAAHGEQVGIAAADVSTGEFRVAVAPRRDADAWLARLAPRELLLAKGNDPGALGALDGVLVTEREAWEFDPSLAGDDLRRQFAVHSLEGFGLGAEDAPAVGAAGALLRYLRELQPGGLPHLQRPAVERAGGTMPLDEMTRRNLELVESLRPGADGDRAGTLLGVLDRTQTPMGARLLRQWLLAPLVGKDAIDARLDAVSAIAADALAREQLREALDGVRDVERLASKAAAGRATPRELRALGDSLGRLPAVAEALKRLMSVERGASSVERTPSTLDAPRSTLGRLADVAARWDDCGTLCSAITEALVARPPLQLGDEPTIAPGHDPELDDLCALRDGGKDSIAEIQAAERARTGIQSLKVGFNRVFGYYLEISNAHRERVPADYQRRQTLSGGERYVTPALKEYEEKVLGAAERIEARERALFEALRTRAGGEVARLQAVAARLAELDVLAALAEVAEREGYVRPLLTDGFDLDVVGGRHPVVERMMAREKFIPNDVRLVEESRLVILTGPNMAGKSTILRQVGLIQLMAQVGSFVPATRATLGLVDRLFTRVGASDNLVRGQSTFMVEMTETSAILNTATRRSLVLLDEIGRGTSTYDGVSIAWSVSEHLHDRVGCKTIFATHYHELVALADELPAVRNMTVAVREVGDQVLFLHRLVDGGADRSYGIEVGRLAGLPAPVLARAKEVLALLEGEGAQMASALNEEGASSVERRAPRRPPRRSTLDARRPAADQLALFGFAEPPPPHPVVVALQQLDPDHLTPMQALELLARLAADAKRP
ncbi:DNA mismatch repair protein MutS [Roseisolibacter sp. H3M3-2]|uniref:DNA mismatch repair protein MutS n=1 Tax=Roseisolibacter sp. H3M3-2 TaxID=3031323 RepID=UPI0023DA58B6|nr:DNA mismatch repair protein MutS [Roseisolibacter sp. H3M3-2]MDF1502305.1 DNA mismatch repair protein MutS [Roseisolibacter sp. H3M3-2]